jgi:hypothetical protein
MAPFSVQTTLLLGTHESEAVIVDAVDWAMALPTLTRSAATMLPRSNNNPNVAFALMHIAVTFGERRIGLRRRFLVLILNQ